MSARILPAPLGMAVELYVSKALSDARNWDNSEPLDENGVYCLYLLAADIYAAGWEDGERAEAERNRGARAREREADAARGGDGNG